MQRSLFFDIAKAAQALKEKNIESYQLDAELLMLDTLKITKEELFLNGRSRELDLSEREIYLEKINRRKEYMPVAYITGYKEFYLDKFKVNGFSLIPRAETELLVDIAKEQFDLEKEITILDLCTGSAAVGISIANLSAFWKVTVSDILPELLDLIKTNISDLARYQNVEPVISDLFDRLEGRKFDLIVSNPPYLSKTEKRFLQPEIDMEPEIALFADDEKGLSLIEKIIARADKFMKDDAFLAIETSFLQKDDLIRFVSKNRFLEFESYLKDLNNLERVALIRKGK